MKKLISFILLGTFFTLSYSQITDISSLPFNRAKMLFNPALTGVQRNPMISSHLINKWPALGSQYQTELITYEHKIEKIKSGFGIGLIHDSQGDGFYKNHIFNASYAYYFPLGEDWKLSGGVQLSYFHGSKAEEDYSILTSNGFFNNYSPSQKYDCFYFGLGFSFINDKFIGGFSLDNLTESTIPLISHYFDYSEIGRRYLIHAGYSVISNDNYNLLPTIYFFQQLDYQFIKCAIDYRYKKFIGNLSYVRNFKFHYNGMILGFGYQGRRLGIMYNYEMIISSLTNQTLGTHMLSLNYIFKKK